MIVEKLNGGSIRKLGGRGSHAPLAKSVGGQGGQVVKGQSFHW